MGHLETSLRCETHISESTKVIPFIFINSEHLEKVHTVSPVVLLWLNLVWHGSSVYIVTCNSSIPVKFVEVLYSCILGYGNPYLSRRSNVRAYFTIDYYGNSYTCTCIRNPPVLSDLTSSDPDRSVHSKGNGPLSRGLVSCWIFLVCCLQP